MKGLVGMDGCLKVENAGLWGAAATDRVDRPSPRRPLARAPAVLLRVRAGNAVPPTEVDRLRRRLLRTEDELGRGRRDWRLTIDEDPSGGFRVHVQLRAGQLRIQCERVHQDAVTAVDRALRCIGEILGVRSALA